MSHPAEQSPDDRSSGERPSADRPSVVGSELDPARVRTLLGVLITAAFVVILNETVLSVALPDLMHELSIPATTAQWLTTGFMLTMAVVIPTTGFILQRLPHRTVFLAAMALFVLGTALAMAAPGFPVLMIGRVVQACGTALTLPLLMTTVLTVIPEQRRGTVMGLISVVISVAPAIGPTLSGLVLGALGWRWLFLLMLPIAVAALILGAVLMPAMSEQRRVSLDLVSVPLSALGFGGLVMGLSTIGSEQPAVPPIPSLLAGVAALVLFVLRQRVLQRQDRALLDLRPFARPVFSISLGLMIVSMGGLFGVIILLPIFLQEVLGLSTTATGLTMLPGGLLMGLLSPFVGRLYDRFGARVLVIPGALLLCLGMLVMSRLSEDSTQAAVIAGHMVISGGLALMITPLMTSALGSLPQSLYSHGSALLNTLQQVAGAAGGALFITLMAIGSLAAADRGAAGAAAIAHGVHVAFLVGFGITVLAAVISLFVPRRAEGTSARREIR
ncbi:MDR family MFS transporter [Kocuria palustris]|uniref:MDR family MFS transporter n=1 Tax=Kocuria palustris TaxID=71999 RepID=UPI0021B2669F|nr:MDR family MFS transporter [Kocuria palustris]